MDDTHLDDRDNLKRNYYTFDVGPYEYGVSEQTLTSLSQISIAVISAFVVAITSLYIWNYVSQFRSGDLSKSLQRNKEILRDTHLRYYHQLAVPHLRNVKKEIDKFRRNEALKATKYRKHLRDSLNNIHHHKLRLRNRLRNKPILQYRDPSTYCKNFKENKKQKDSGYTYDYNNIQSHQQFPEIKHDGYINDGARIEKNSALLSLHEKNAATNYTPYPVPHGFGGNFNAQTSSSSVLHSNGLEIDYGGWIPKSLDGNFVDSAFENGFRKLDNRDYQVLQPQRVSKASIEKIQLPTYPNWYPNQDYTYQLGPNQESNEHLPRAHEDKITQSTYENAAAAESTTEKLTIVTPKYVIREIDLNSIHDFTHQGFQQDRV